MKLHYGPIKECSANAIRIVAAIEGGQAIELVAQEKNKEPITLETPQGDISSANAIMKFVSGSGSGKLLGASAINKAHVDQWLAWRETTLAPCMNVVLAGIFGHGGIQKADYDEQSKALKAHMKTLNTFLEGKKWLAGDDITLADIVLATSLQAAFQTTLDGGFRKAMKNVETWALANYARPEYIAVNGNVHMAGKALKPSGLIEPVKVKKEAPKPAAKKEAKPEKPKNNIDALPPTNFNVYDYKTFYVNHPDKKGAAIDETYKMLDWEGWSYWHFHYDIYGDEGAKLHVTNNLLTGFLSRAEHTSKYTFARMAVLGEEPKLEIKGCWLVRGTAELPDGLAKEHPQMEYYRTRKLDPRNNADDDKIVREYFGANEKAESETIEGMTANTIRWHK
jgi:elongation factor 1-gamma